MHDLDETDLEILRVLAEDGRRPYSDIAERVDLSPPAVSDRVDRLRDRGVIRRFTVDIDRSQLREARPMLVTLTVGPDRVEEVQAALRAAAAVEYVYTTANARVVFHASPPGDPREWLVETVPIDAVRDYRVEPLSSVDRRVAVDATDFALACDECGNTVTEEGTTAEIGGELRQFCCRSCESAYRERYEELAAEAE